MWREEHITRAGVEVIPVQVSHLEELDSLPSIHQDPFDRILIVQALAEKLTLVSKDRILARYGVPVLWQ